MLYEAESGDISFLVSGDAMITRPMAQFREPRFLELVELVRGADLSITNLEMLFHDYSMSWEIKDSISYTVSDPANLDDLKWLGFDLVCTATNHAFDYNEAGFLATLRNVADRGLLQAGGGKDLAHARAPTFAETPRGRVAVMAATSSFQPQEPAGPGRHGLPGKPGVNAIRSTTTQHVSGDDVGILRRLKDQLGISDWEAASRVYRPRLAGDPDTDDAVTFFGSTFHASDAYRTTTELAAADLSDIANWVRGARRQADWVIYSLHSHESGPAGPWHGGSSSSPPDHLIQLAHSLIEQGCDLVFCHGPHLLRGIEIYQGRPILYSLGNFVFQNETVAWLPEPAYSRQQLGPEATPGDWGHERSGGGSYGFAANEIHYHSAVCSVSFASGKLSKVEIHPIELGFGKPVSQRGRPMLARPEAARSILANLKEMSRAFGTEILIDGDQGSVALPD